MDSRLNRPVTVAVVQGLLIFFSLLLLFALAASLAVFSLEFREGLPITSLLYIYSVMGGMILLLLIAFRGLVKRRMFGKWLAVVSMILIWAVIIFGSLSDAFGYQEYTGFGQFVGNTVLQLLLHGGFLFLILRLAFSRTINEFFKQQA